MRAVVGALRADRAFASLSWPDAEQVADAITSTLIDHAADAAHAAEHLRQRTRDALAGTDGIVWNDREAAARALNIAASGALRAREDCSDGSGSNAP